MMKLIAPSLSCGFQKCVFGTDHKFFTEAQCVAKMTLTTCCYFLKWMY